MPKVDISYETLDNIVVAGLKLLVHECKYVLNTTTHPDDQADYNEYTKAAKVLLKYYGGQMTVKFVMLPMFKGTVIYWNRVFFNNGNIYSAYRLFCFSIRIYK